MEWGVVFIMQKRYIPGKTKLKDESKERGSITMLTLGLVLILLLLFVIMCEFGRVMLVREQLQTATDAAALAGAGSELHRQVKINVVSDLGYKKKTCYDESGEYPCCGTRCRDENISLSVVGEEKHLIEKNGWREYCVEPCECGGGDCWFELIDRNIHYETSTVRASSDQNEISNEISKVEDELTDVSRLILVESQRDYSSYLSTLFNGMTMKNMLSILNDSDYFISRWMSLKSYPINCWESQVGQYNFDCLQWRSVGQNVYRNLKDKRKSIERNIATVDNMRQVNQKPSQLLDEKYTKSAGKFFDANTPANVTNAGIHKIISFDKWSTPNKTKYSPSLILYAKADIKTLFPQFFNNFSVETCSQAATSYRSVKSQTSSGNKFRSWSDLPKGLWEKPPEDACWKEF